MGQSQAQGETRAHGMPDDGGAPDANGVEEAAEPVGIERRRIGNAGLVGEAMADQVGDEESEAPAEGFDLVLPVPDGPGIAVEQDDRRPLAVPDVCGAMLIDADEPGRVAVKGGNGGNLKSLHD